ncbi:alpha/beta fold hydrolase [Nocardioides sp.]|uniref:alpha/beta fold hydrolase n=1 Tax=Nocardioides sp. TaxID=35761 RepID=UPI00351462AC
MSTDTPRSDDHTGASARIEHLTTPDGRTLEVRQLGADDAPALVFHHGTPGAAAPLGPVEHAASSNGLRLITVSRPGYGASTPLRAPEPVLADVHDTVTVLDHLGITEFVTLGWSGGGPRALACAAALPGRCRAAASWVGVAPRVGFDGDWLDGMGEENLEEFGAALEGPEALRALLERWHPDFAAIEGSDLVAGMGDLLPEVDQAFLTPELAGGLAATFRHALAPGIDGWWRDDLAFVDDWGVDLASMTVPVAIWQGGDDRMVPQAHATHLGERTAGAVVHLLPGEGHLSLMARLDEIVADLRRLAGW